MSSTLVIGGTGFIGRHTVQELLEHDYDVTALSRSVEGLPDTWPEVSTIEADRTDPEALADAADSASPDIVIDCALFHPEDARTAVAVFENVDAYVYVSSGGVYARDDIPKRESVTPLHDYSPEHGEDDSMASYGPRKAECDRLVTAAANDGVSAMSLRPTMVYGPKTVGSEESAVSGSVSWAAELPGIQNHHEYWIDRLSRYDQVVVPGDGTAIWHRV